MQGTIEVQVVQGAISLFNHSGSFERICVVSVNGKSTFDLSLTEEGYSNLT
jgi:hypothetical protein